MTEGYGLVTRMLENHGSDEDWDGESVERMADKAALSHGGGVCELDDGGENVRVENAGRRGLMELETTLASGHRQ